MKRIALSVLVVALFVANWACAAESNKPDRGEPATVFGYINSIHPEESSATYSVENSASANGLANGQHPVVTVVTCSDTRVLPNLLRGHSDGELYLVRNIGNSFAPAQGLIEHGIRRLHTPLLLFIGYARRGADAAASSNNNHDLSSIRHATDSADMNKDTLNMDSVKANIQDQVVQAMQHFASEVEDNKLVIAGAVLVFTDELHQEAGKFIIVNVNGESDPAKLPALDRELPGFAISRVASPGRAPVEIEETRKFVFRAGLETHAARTAYSGTFNNKSATARYVDLAVGFIVDLGYGHFLNVDASSGIGKHDLYQPPPDQLVRHNSIGFTISTPFWEYESAKANYFAGYKNDTTRMLATGQAWSVDKIETYGVLGGFELDYRMRQGLLKLMVEADLFTAKWTDDTGYSAQAKSSLGAKTGIAYTWRYSHNLAGSFDFTRQTHRYDHTTFKDSRTDTMLGLNVLYGF
jgi:carbonic anhydrase